MADRFKGKDGERRLADSLAEQVLVGGDATLASELARCGELLQFQAGDQVIVQGGHDNDIYFIVLGAVDVFVHGRKVASRRAGSHVGEMALVQPAQLRSATVTASEQSVLLRVSEPDFVGLGDTFPVLWRRIAKELARRLEQRNSLVANTRDKIRIFIMSSVESLDIARAIQNGLEYDPYLVVVWTDGVFRASSYPIDALEGEVDQSDFAIAIAHADDVTHTRGKTWPTARDNVVFELGLFIGRLVVHLVTDGVGNL
ncbi:TIR domain-containing protein [Capsulimonas corticalis]|nr:TIR domain-containing protein [Capsulimonas corticalis]